MKETPIKIKKVLGLFNHMELVNEKKGWKQIRELLIKETLLPGKYWDINVRCDKQHLGLLPTNH